MVQPLTPQASHPRSVGENIFDWTTYGAVNGVGTFLLTVPVADYLKSGGGAKYYQQASHWLEHKGLPFMPKNWRAPFVSQFLMTTILMQGGNLMLFPVGMAESVKTPIVKGINKAFGDTSDISHLENAPKQTAWSLIQGRLAAFGAVWAGLASAEVFFKPQMAQFENAMGRATCAFMNRPMLDALGKETKTFRYGKMAAFDVFATATATALLYVGSKFFARKQHEQQLVPPTLQTIQLADAITAPSSASPIHTSNTPSTHVNEIERAPHTIAQPPAQGTSLAHA